MNRLLPLLTLAALPVLAGCATPDVVDVKQAGDKNLSCAQIATALNDASNFEKQARDTRKVNGRNVATAVLFWPALLGTYANSEEAIDAAKERRVYLMELSEQKGC